MSNKTATLRHRKRGETNKYTFEKWIDQLASMFDIVGIEGDLHAKAAEVLDSFKEPEEDSEAVLPFTLDTQDQEDILEITDLYMPARNVVNNTLILIDKETGSKAIPDIGVYKDQFNPTKWNEIKPHIPLRIFKYHVGEDMPTEGHIPTATGRKTYRFCNTYLPPIWTSEPVSSGLHEDHKKMIETRFKDAESLERYFCALYHTITSRNKTIVGLVHKRQGTGKSITMGALPGVLVGLENYSVTDRNFIQSKHKDILLEKRAILLDEAVIYRSDATRVKQLTEQMLYVDPKGIKALNVENHISWFLASNNEADIYTEPTDRRYCFLEDSGEKITEVMGIDWVTKYMERLYNDTSFVANLGHYVLNEFSNPKYAEDAIYKGATFERVVRATAMANFGAVIDDLLSIDAEEISYYTAKRNYQKEQKIGGRAPNYPTPTEFIDFFTYFRWKQEPICEVVQGEKRTDITLNPV